MQPEAVPFKNSAASDKRTGVVKNSLILLLAFASAFFPRLLTTLRIPALINFLHFVLVPYALGLIILKARPKDQHQLSVVRELLVGLWVFLIAIFTSALLNNAGVINVVLKFLLLGEPFMLLLALVLLPLSQERFNWFRSWINRFLFFHLFLVYVQKFVLRLHRLPGEMDNIQGVFYRSGSGHVVGASVSCSFAVYYFFWAKEQPLWKRSLVAALGFGNVIISDAKQVVLTLVLGFVILSLSKVKDFGRFLSYVIGIAIFITGFTWAIYNIEALSAFTVWIRPEMYGSDGYATVMKSSGIRITIEHFHSPLNWLMGLGPGHTIDRLGGWMLKDYSALLTPLGATRTTVGDETWAVVFSGWADSSFFSPFWGWAAIWCDLGFVGLGAYLYLCSIVWRRICVGDIPKFLMLTVAVHGFIFTQMEEPGYMLFIATLIGLIWHQQFQERWEKAGRQ